MRKHNGQHAEGTTPGEERAFAQMGASGRDAEPALCLDLHSRIMQRIEEEQDGRTLSVAPHTAVRASTGIRFGQYVAIAASVSLLLVAAWLWPGAAGLPRSADLTTLNPNVPPESNAEPEDRDAAVRSENTPEIVSVATRDHQTITAAINYLLTLGNTQPTPPVPRNRQPSATLDENTPWLRPAVSEEMVAFELDQRRLEQLADALFAMQE